MNPRRSCGIAAFMLVTGTLAAVAASPASAVEFRKFDTGVYSQTMTACDREAGHPDDPHKVGPGVRTAEVNLVAAIAACSADLAKDPQNPRLLYQLARALTYAGRVEEALPIIEKSAAAKYPQALFVTGYLYLSSAYSAPTNLCRAAELIRESAIYGRKAGLLGYPAYVLQGRFAGCPIDKDFTELAAFVDEARKMPLDYFQQVLADTITSQLAALR